MVIEKRDSFPVLSCLNAYFYIIVITVDRQHCFDFYPTFPPSSYSILKVVGVLKRGQNMSISVSFKDVSQS